MNEKESSNNNTIKRVITGLIMGIIVFSCFAAGGWFLFLMVCAFIVAGAMELIAILKHRGFFPHTSIVILTCILFIIIFKTNNMELYPLALTLGVLTSFLAVLFDGKQPYISNISSTIFSFIYSSLPVFIISLREIEIANYTLNISFLTFRAGFYFLMMVFFAVLFTDVFAYFFGKKYGKRKLAPIVSPKKTVEGAIAGSVGALFAALVIGALMNLEWYHSLILGILITAFAQLGDLCESLIKRDAGVKDSGTALAGHGGFLDRADSYIFSIPVAYFYIYFFIYNTDWINNFVGRLF